MTRAAIETEACSEPNSPANPGGKPVPQSVFKRRTLRVLMASFRTTVWCIVGSFLFTVLLILLFTRHNWELNGILLYTPLPVPENQKSLYTPPAVPTLVALVKSPQSLEKVMEQFELDMTVRSFDKLIKVEQTKGTEVITVTLKWADGNDGAAIINRLMELFIQQLNETRAQRMAGSIIDLEADLQTSRQRLAAAHEAYHRFQIEEKTLDAKGGLDKLNQDIMTLETALSLAKRTQLGCVTQINKLDKHLTDLKSQDVKEGENAQQFEAAQETVADNRRRQDRLRELIEDERKQLELQPLLETKQKEYARILELFNRRAATINQVEKLQSEIGALTARVKDSEKVKQWKEELDRIDKVVVPKGQKPGTGSPIIQQALTRRLELDLQIAGIQEEINQLESQLAAKQKMTGEVAGLQRKAELLLKDIETFDLERQRVELQLAVMRQLQGSNKREAVIVTPAKPGPHPTGSNRKILLPAGMFVGLFLSLGWLVLRDRIWGHPTSEEIGIELGVPIIGPADKPGEDERSLRELGLRLRQHVGKSGGLLLFTSAGRPGHLEKFLKGISNCLTRRDERILLIDARVAAGTTPHLNDIAPEGCAGGLADYLDFQKIEPADVIHPTILPALDYIPAGDEPALADTLATHRMRELLADAGRHYSLVLVIGPAVDATTDLQILTAHAQGVVLFLDNAGAPIPAIRTFLKTMNELDAPFLGAIASQAK